MDLATTTEIEFHRLADEWKQHCKENSLYSFDQPYLNCDAYRTLAMKGEEILPYIRDRVRLENLAFEDYDKKVKARMRVVLGRDDIRLFNEPYFKMCQDPQYKQLCVLYDQNLFGSPSHLWGYLLAKIVPGFALPIEKEGGNGPIKSVKGFMGMDVRKTELAIVKWIDDYLLQKEGQSH